MQLHRSSARFTLFLCLAAVALVAPRHVSSQDAQLKPIKKVVPEYPEALRKLAISGVVRLRVSVDADGNVEDVEIRGGNAIFSEVAAKAVKQWKYAPGAAHRSVDVGIAFECCSTIRILS
jgi:TonB family protein